MFDCKHVSSKICFNVLNYVFIFNLYCLVNFNKIATILATPYIASGSREVIEQRYATVVPSCTTRIDTCLLLGLCKVSVGFGYTNQGC